MEDTIEFGRTGSVSIVTSNCHSPLIDIRHGAEYGDDLLSPEDAKSVADDIYEAIRYCKLVLAG